MRLLQDEDTYVFGGLGLLSTGIGIISASAFGAIVGAGASLVTVGTGAIGIGVWMLSPSGGE